jgi:hypothetical protein
MDYDQLFAEQEGKCAICGLEWKPTNWRGQPSRKMHRDHDHTTLKPRGLLCQNCNRHLKDKFDAPWYLAAYNYLMKYAGK